MDYNIQCGSGRIAYVTITDIDLEPKNCWDQSIGEDRSDKIRKSATFSYGYGGWERIPLIMVALVF